MPAQFQCFKDHFILIYSGVLKLDEAIEMYNRLSEDPQFDSTRFAIIDCRDLQQVTYSEGDYRIHASISMAVSRWQRVDENFRVGVVAPTTEIEEAVKKVIQHASDFKQTWDRQLFKDYDEAFRWASTPLI